MSFAETRIIYGETPAYEPEDEIIYGERVAELVIRKGWISPNYLYGAHWARSRVLRDELNQQVANHIIQLPLEERARAVLREPVARLLRITIYQIQGRFPDVDNLLGGLKHLIDALKKVRYKFSSPTSSSYRPKVISSLNGNGLIWDDAPKYLRIAEVFIQRHERGTALGKNPKYDKKTSNYVNIEVFEFPEEELTDE